MAPNPRANLMGRWGLSSARLGSFVGKYGFLSNSQGQMWWVGDSQIASCNCKQNIIFSLCNQKGSSDRQSQEWSIWHYQHFRVSQLQIWFVFVYSLVISCHICQENENTHALHCQGENKKKNDPLKTGYWDVWKHIHLSSACCVLPERFDSNFEQVMCNGEIY